jgi:hypothetical protein
MPRKRNLYSPSSTAPYPLSRSKIECFLRCPRCFYLDRRLGISPPSTQPFTINSAIDKLWKHEFDIFRDMQKPHPIMRDNNIPALPFAHPDLLAWRNNFKGIRFVHQPTNFEIYGAVDDVWAKEDGELIVVDYKATSSKEDIITLEHPEYRQAYKRQLEIYQHLFRANGFKVSNTAYLVYANCRTEGTFQGRLTFKIQLVEVMGSTDWIDGALKMAKECLEGEVPEPNPDCELCGYVQAVRKAG